MRKFILFCFLAGLALPSVTLAAELSEADFGTYAILKRDKSLTGMYYRLSKVGNNWLIEGKKSNQSWQNLSCEKGCEYKKTTNNQIAAYFPADWRANSDIACIQNTAQAFCKISKKDDPDKVMHIVIALVTAKPTPIFLKRVHGAS